MSLCVWLVAAFLFLLAPCVSAAASLIGAAVEAGLPVSLSSPVYPVMDGGSYPEGLEPRKRARIVHAYFAGGNDGQGILAVPELDVVIAIFGSNYSSRLGLEIQQCLTSRYILPAIRGAGDAMSTPVVPRKQEIIDGRKPRIPGAPTH